MRALLPSRGLPPRAWACTRKGKRRDGSDDRRGALAFRISAGAMKRSTGARPALLLVARSGSLGSAVRRRLPCPNGQHASGCRAPGVSDEDITPGVLTGRFTGHLEHSNCAVEPVCRHGSANWLGATVSLGAQAGRANGRAARRVRRGPRRAQGTVQVARLPPCPPWVWYSTAPICWSVGTWK
jgi:hypothetical protein